MLGRKRMERSMTTETRLVSSRNRKVAVSPVEWRAVQLLKHVEACVWAQGLGAPVTAHALRRELDDAFRHRPEAGT